MSARRPRSKSTRLESGKKIVKKEEVEDPLIVQLKAISDTLQDQNATLQESVNYYQNKLHAIIEHIINNNVDNYQVPPGTVLTDLPVSDVTKMITSLTIAPTSMFQHYEGQLEDIHRRVTELSHDLVQMINLKAKIERELHGMQNMTTVEDLKVTAKRLWYHCYSTSVCAPTEVTTPDMSDFNQSSVNSVSPDSKSVEMQGIQTAHGIQDAIPELYLRVLNPKARSIIMTPIEYTDSDSLEPPKQKLPGETHIFNMHVGLRSRVIRELSQHKANASDWRLMATRVGIPDNLIQQWIRMRAPNAMALVMRVWGDSCGATVRMLHRHLLSPQMKAVALAKRISDFYQVD